MGYGGLCYKSRLKAYPALVDPLPRTPSQTVPGQSSRAAWGSYPHEVDNCQGSTPQAGPHSPHKSQSG